MESKKLEGIKPFNEYVFRSCYYNQLLAVYNYYGLDKRFLLFNSIPIYKFNNKTKSCKIQFLDLFNEKELEKMTSLRLLKKKHSDCLINDVIKSIDKETPIMVCVDTFYLPYRQDSYMEHHYPHFILVYGYDLDKKTFTVNEHMYVNSMVYGEMQIDMDILVKAHENVMIKKNSVIRFIQGNSIEEFDLTLFKAKINDKKEKIVLSEKNLKRMIQFIVDSLDGEDKLNKNINNIMEFLQDLKWKKTVEYYYYNSMFNNEELMEKNQFILNSYIFIFGALYRYSITKRYFEESILKIKERCLKIIELEKWKDEFLLGVLPSCI